MRKTLLERFWDKVSSEPNSRGCWIWTAACSTTGYGRIQDARGFNAQASRVSWELYNGPIPPGLYVCHTCDVRSCVNPRHLFLGTPKDNMQDKIAKGRATPPDMKKTWASGKRRGRLDETQIAEILTALEAGTLQKAVAARFGIDQALVSRIATGKAYARAGAAVPNKKRYNKRRRPAWGPNHGRRRPAPRSPAGDEAGAVP